MRKPTLRTALEASMTAIDDWLNVYVSDFCDVYASDFCDEERVREAAQRISKAGGTLSYIARVQQANRDALSRSFRIMPANEAKKRLPSRRKAGG